MLRLGSENGETVVGNGVERIATCSRVAINVIEIGNEKSVYKVLDHHIHSALARPRNNADGTTNRQKDSYASCMLSKVVYGFVIYVCA